MSAETAKPGAREEAIRIFVSYAREDRRWLDPGYQFNLIPFLTDSLRRHNALFWFDHELKGGDEYKRLILDEIDRSQIAILIVSQSFLNSEFIETFEMPRISDRAHAGEMLVIPVLVEPCDWQDYSFLADRQMVPGASPLIDFTESVARWANVKFQILEGLKTQVKRIREARAEAALAQERTAEAARLAAEAKQARLEKEADFRRVAEEGAALRAAAEREAEQKRVEEAALAERRRQEREENARRMREREEAARKEREAANTIIADETDGEQEAKHAQSSDPNRTAKIALASAVVLVILGFVVAGISSWHKSQPSYVYQSPTAAPSDFNFGAALQSPIFRSRCDNHDGGGCAALGKMYEEGEGVAKDLDQALSLYKSACTYKNGWGCRLAAEVYIHRGGSQPMSELDASAGFLGKACKIEADYDCQRDLDGLGSLYFLAKSYAKAGTQYQQACTLGYSTSCVSLGSIAFTFYEGKDVARSYSKSAAFNQTACNGGNAAACNYLGVLYAAGNGVPQSYSKALSFYQKACDGNDAGGCANVGEVYWDGDGVPQDKVKALPLIQKGCDAGITWACDDVKKYQGQQ